MGDRTHARARIVDCNHFPVWHCPETVAVHGGSQRRECQLIRGSGKSAVAINGGRRLHLVDLVPVTSNPIAAAAMYSRHTRAQPVQHAHAN
jgi:hypothetical protein